MNEPQRCPNCPDAQSRPRFTDASGRRVMRCASCGLQFAERYPDLAAAQSEIYGDRYFEHPIAMKRQREEIFEMLLREVESVLGRTGRLLDIGAGECTSLAAAARLGWDPEGTEVSAAMIRYAREHYPFTVHAGELETLALEPRSYDAIILNHVLEHVRNPRTTLETTAELLCDGGVVRIEVPNLASLSSRLKNLQSRLGLKRNPWKHYSTDHHFWFFTPPTLLRTLEGAGLSVLALKAPARQWGRKNSLDSMLNALYGKTLWGKHLVAYARPARHGGGSS